jgi:hypothetical protein
MPLFLNALASLRNGTFDPLLYPNIRDKEDFS